MMCWACAINLNRLQHWQCRGQEGVAGAAGAAAAPLQHPWRRPPSTPLCPPLRFPTSHYSCEQLLRVAVVSCAQFSTRVLAGRGTPLPSGPGMCSRKVCTCCRCGLIATSTRVLEIGRSSELPDAAGRPWEVFQKVTLGPSRGRGVTFCNPSDSQDWARLLHWPGVVIPDTWMKN